MTQYRNIHYETAQICENGHIINIHAIGEPGANAKYCTKCGKPTHMHCPSCGAHVRGCEHSVYTHSSMCYTGDEYSRTVSGFDCLTENYEAPAYCHECNAPYPWTLAKINAYNRLLGMINDISPEDRACLQSIFPDLLVVVPDSIPSAQTTQAILHKLGGISKGALKAFLQQNVLAAVLQVFS